jgi:ribosomal protein L35
VDLKKVKKDGFPAKSAEIVDAVRWWYLFTVQLETPRGRYDEYSSKVFSQLRNQGMSIRRGADKRLKVMLTGLITLQQGRHLRHLLTHLQPIATRNLHTTQPNTLLPTYDEVVNLTSLL